MTKNPDLRSRDSGPFAGCLATALLFGMPGYALSIGPFVWLANRGYLPQFVGVIYVPIGLLGYWEPARRIIHWYISFWQ
jgi:hypothetical protein